MKYITHGTLSKICALTKMIIIAIDKIIARTGTI